MKILEFRVSGWIDIRPIRDRWYRLVSPVNIFIHVAGLGWVVYRFKAGFLFDGRSGGPLADFIVPNLGTQEELACWLIHDANGYDLLLSFYRTNEMLRQMLLLAWGPENKPEHPDGFFVRTVPSQKKGDLARAWAVYRAVSLSRSWFGEPKAGDREYHNVKPGEKLFTVRHHAQLREAA